MFKKLSQFRVRNDLVPFKSKEGILFTIFGFMVVDKHIVIGAGGIRKLNVVFFPFRCPVFIIDSWMKCPQVSLSILCSSSFTTELYLSRSSSLIRFSLHLLDCPLFKVIFIEAVCILAVVFTFLYLPSF